VGEHHDCLVLLGERPAEARAYAKYLKIVRRHCQCQTHLARLSDADGNQALRDHRLRFAEIFEVNIRNEPKRLAFGRGENPHDFLWPRDRQRTQEDRIDDA
jgi:hypothetical protein